MIQLTNDFKNKVIAGLLTLRENYQGPDGSFAKTLEIHNSVWSRLKNGEREGLLKDSQWINLGRELNISAKDKEWKFVRTEVFNHIEEEVLFCKENSKSMILVDDADIGKTVAGKYLSKTLKNCFFISACQTKTKQQFIRTLAKTIGVDGTGKYVQVKANIKYCLKSVMDSPIIIIDEAGDLEYPAFLELKELWNATEGCCGWYMMGADGLEEKMKRGIASKKVGYREIFRRYSNKFSKVVPFDKLEKKAFYEKLISDVVNANIKDKSQVKNIVRRCLTMDDNGNIGGLSRADSLLILNQQ